MRLMLSIGALTATLAVSQNRGFILRPEQEVDIVPVTATVAAEGRVMVSKSRGVVFRASSDGNAQYLLNVRTAPSEVERHAGWDDLLIVRSGYGTLRYGRTVRGDRAIAQGEQRGGTLVREKEVTLSPGDLVRIPAGTAHSVAPAGEAPVVYLVVKVRRSVSLRRGT